MLGSFIGVLILVAYASRSKYESDSSLLFDVHVVNGQRGNGQPGYWVAIVSNRFLDSTDILLADDGIWTPCKEDGHVGVFSRIAASGTTDMVFGIRGSLEPATLFVKGPDGTREHIPLADCLRSKDIAFCHDGIPVIVSAPVAPTHAEQVTPPNRP